MEHNKPNWDKLQAISVLTSDSPKLGPALKKNPYTGAQKECNGGWGWGGGASKKTVLNPLL